MSNRWSINITPAERVARVAIGGLAAIAGAGGNGVELIGSADTDTQVTGEVVVGHDRPHVRNLVSQRRSVFQIDWPVT